MAQHRVLGACLLMCGVCILASWHGFLPVEAMTGQELRVKISDQRPSEEPMASDAQSKEPVSPRANLWKLPEIVDVKAVLVQYRTPVIRYMGRDRVEYREAVELSVQTSDELPARALSPALYVGDVAITDYEVAGKNLYRFFAFNIRELQEGAPITMDWPQLRRGREHRAPVFRVSGEETR